MAEAIDPPQPVTGQHLFVYGSLVDPRCLDEALGHVHPGERLAASLAGFRRVVGDYPYPYLLAAAADRVEGLLIMDLTPDDFAALDRYEQVDDGLYERQAVAVEIWGCGPRTGRIQAHTYVAGPALRARVPIGTELNLANGIP